MRKFSLQGFLILSVLSSSACQAGGSSKPKADAAGGGAPTVVKPLADDTPILEYKGGKITAKDVNQFVAPKIKQMNEQVTDMYAQAAEQALVMRLLEEEAKKQGLANPQAVLEKNVAPANVTDDDVKKFIKENKLEKGYKDPKSGKMTKVSTEEIRGYLMEQGSQTQRQNYLQGLMSAAQPKTLFEEPRTNVPDRSTAYFKGGASAKVVIHEFSDFECPFCNKGKEVVDQIHAAYGDKVKIVFRHFPLNFHPNAKPAAVAATCAGRQGKFWEMHDKMFSNQKDLTAASFDRWAKELSLDLSKFSVCVKGGEPNQEVDEDMKVSETIGVNSTPTFFVNGKKVAGALPFAKFKTMIDSELARAGN